jgi:hypothetical protein
MVISKRKLVHVVLEVLRRHGVIRPVDRALQLTPKPLDSVGMSYPSDVLADAVVDALMDVTEPVQGLVDASLADLGCQCAEKDRTRG